ncbi:hypothetical protein ACJ51O_36915 (plasmid) [Burkholderia pyrrocinia]|uniref:hypothetical protein n=1 Tax=Burkholderia pyrrocinia TaxID=60550 RepID=UPI0038B50CAF
MVDFRLQKARVICKLSHLNIAWGYMNSTRIESARRLDTWCTGGVDYSYRGAIHHETRSKILKEACRAPQFDQKGQVGRLEFLASGVFWGKLDVRDDLTRVANKIGDSGLASPIKRRLIKIAGCNARQAKAEVTSSLGFAMEVARARVMNGAPCGRTAVEHGITYTEAERLADPRKSFVLYRAQIWIQKRAVDGPAGRRVECGESCSIVAREHEIFLSEALEVLESKAILSVGREMVNRGDTFENIVDALGITLRQSKKSLQYMIRTRAKNQAV